MQYSKSDSRSQSETERAVSPVIGVILMVAITVVLAGVIGVMVFGLADDLGDTTPSATLDIDNVEEESFTLYHEGGDSLETDDLSVIVNGSSEGTVYDNLDVPEGNESISAGESLEISDDDWDVEENSSLTISHIPSDSVLASYEPDN